MNYRELTDIESAAKKAYAATGADRVESVFDGRVVMVKLVDSMINRGMATGTTLKANYYLDGKRTAFSKVVAAMDAA